jgi:ribose transport system substrate-binding protein
MQTSPLRRSWPAIAALVFCALGLSACSPSPPTPAVSSGNTAAAPVSPGTPASAGKTFRLGCTIPTFGHPFFVAMKKGLDEQAAGDGAGISIVDGEDQTSKQVTAIDNFLVQKVDAIILCPTESKNLVNSVKKANGENVPVITVNRTVDSGKVVTYVGADDTEGGRLQGKALLQALPKGGSIILLQGVLGSSPQRNREAGLEEALNGHPEYQIVQKIPTNFKRNEGIKAMDRVLVQYSKGKINAVVAQSDDGAIAAAKVCGEKGRTEITIVGFNGESDAFALIKAGKVYATVLQDAETQGREAVKATLRHLKGEKVKPLQITPLYLVTQANIGKYKPAWQSTE